MGASEIACETINFITVALLLRAAIGEKGMHPPLNSGVNPVPECLRITLRRSKFQNFSGVAFPQTPLEGYGRTTLILVPTALLTNVPSSILCIYSCCCRVVLIVHAWEFLLHGTTVLLKTGTGGCLNLISKAGS